VSVLLPDPVTIGYIGSCTSVCGLVTNGVFAFLPSRWRGPSSTVTACVGVGAGIVGLVVWALALAGALDYAGVFLPQDVDLFGFVSGLTGLVSLLGGAVLVYIRFAKERDVDIGIWLRRVAFFAAAASLLVYLQVPAVHS
jgi:hypothetical protein